MMTRYGGSASIKAMEPLLRIASLPKGTRLNRCGEGEFVAEVGPDYTVTLHLLDPAVRMILRNSGSIHCDVTMRAFGDQHSGAYWYPFSSLLRGRPAEGGSVDGLSEVIERAGRLLSQVRFFDDDAAALVSNMRAAAAVDYLRLYSGVPDPWLISLSSPFELRLENESVGEGDGLLLEFGELPPGLDELGECAVVELNNEPAASWYLRPAMLAFESTLESGSTNVVETADRLRELGFTENQMKCLDRVGRQVARAYAREWELAHC